MVSYLKRGAKVIADEVVENRVYIVKPMRGWIPLHSRKGRVLCRRMVDQVDEHKPDDSFGEVHSANPEMPPNASALAAPDMERKHFERTSLTPPAHVPDLEFASRESGAAQPAPPPAPPAPTPAPTLA